MAVTENVVGLVAAFTGLTFWSGGQMMECELLEQHVESQDGRAWGAARGDE